MAIAPKILRANGASLGGGGGVPLPSFQFPGMPVGFIVQDSTGGNWQLVASSAVVDHTTVEKCAVNAALRWVTYSGGGGGGAPTNATYITKSANGLLTGALPLSGLGGPGLLKFAADGTPSAAVPGVDYTGVNWFSQRLREAAVLATQIDSMPFATECESLTTAVVLGGVVGTGNVAQLATENCGVFQFTSGATAASLRVASNVNSAKLVSNPKTQQWAVAARVKIVTTPDAQTYMPICNLSGGSVDHVLGVVGSSDATHLVIWINGAGSTIVVTTQVFPVGTYFNIVLVFDGTTLTALYNGVPIGTTATLTNFDTTPANVRAFSGNGSTAANQEFHMDKWAVFTPSAV